MSPPPKSSSFGQQKEGVEGSVEKKHTQGKVQPTSHSVIITPKSQVEMKQHFGSPEKQSSAALSRHSIQSEEKETTKPEQKAQAGRKSFRINGSTAIDQKKQNPAFIPRLIVTAVSNDCIDTRYANAGFDEVLEKQLQIESQIRIRQLQENSFRNKKELAVKSILQKVHHQEEISTPNIERKEMNHINNSSNQEETSETNSQQQKTRELSKHLEFVKSQNEKVHQEVTFQGQESQKRKIVSIKVNHVEGIDAEIEEQEIELEQLITYDSEEEGFATNSSSKCCSLCIIF